MAADIILGTVFLSHASADKSIVEKVYAGLDRSVTFYDVKTMSPGVQTIEAMKSGISSTAIYVLFHSVASASVWVDFEKSLAEVQVITQTKSRILICPINGSDYRSLPDWMKKYMTTSADFRPNDIVRSIKYLYGRYFEHEFPEKIYKTPGREDLARNITLKVMSTTAVSGGVLNVIVLAGVQGMGRTTLARQLVEDAFRGMRPAGPLFEIPPSGDAVDWHLRLLGDARGEINDEEAASQIAAFESLNARQQAGSLINALRHWGNLNQVVTIRHRWGLRDRGNSLKPWLMELFMQLQGEPTIRLILISERRLPRMQMEGFHNVAQFHLEELDYTTIEYVLNDRIEPRFMNNQRLASLAKKINGHPARANYVSYLVNGGSSIDSLVIAPDAVYAFQDKVLGELFDSGVLSGVQKLILKLFSWFPRLSAEIIKRVFDDIESSKLMQDLWELGEFSLLDQAEMGKYKAPAVVSSVYRRRNAEGDAGIFTKVTCILKEQFEAGQLDYEMIDSLLVAIVDSGQEVSQRLAKSLTSARLEPVIEREYNLGISGLGEQATEHFRRCFRLASLAIGMKTSDDALENMLFYGADSSVRLGSMPDDMIALMKRKGFLSADFIQASYLYHRKRDYDGAATVLARSLKAANFRTRNVRLLARIYLRSGRFALALDTLNELSEAKISRDTGLLIMKVKALRGTRNAAEAASLLAKISSVNDEYGDFSIYKASAALRTGSYVDALRHVKVARTAPKSNQAVLSFLQCACEVESGNNENLASTCAVARSMGRDSDALQLQARAALAAGDWRSAQDYISRIERKDWFDLNVALRVNDKKAVDPDVICDPVASSKTSEEREQILRLSADAIEGSNYA